MRFRPTAPALRHSLRRLALALISVAAVASLLPASPAQAAYPEPNWKVMTGPTGSNVFGTEPLVIVLANGNIVAADSEWDNGGTLNVGAVFLYNGTTMALISRLTGSTANDAVGNKIHKLGPNSFLVDSAYWNGSRGAVTFVDGTTGLDGAVSASNSAVGSTASDGVTVIYYVGNALVGHNAVMPDGGYLVGSYAWNNGATADVAPCASARPPAAPAR